MILARCPECTTTFRVTPEQLKARGGKVRCGKCKAVFNALDTLVEETSPTVAATTEPPVVATVAAAIADERAGPLAAAAAVTSVADSTPEASAAPVAAEVTPVEATPPPPPETSDVVTAESALPAAPAATAPAAPAPETASAALAADPFAPAAIGAEPGVAARETREIRGYSKWAERAVAAADVPIEPAPRGARWPAALFSLLLLVALAAQAAHHFRGEIAARVPESRPWLQQACAALGCTLPLPRQADAISIEGSELQADANRGGLLVLQASLRNRAGFAQAYPALELTLTDTQDHMVIRRVLMPADFLAPGTDPNGAFAAGGDLAIRLWIDARESGAAGYRLYVFYP